MSHPRRLRAALAAAFLLIPAVLAAQAAPASTGAPGVDHLRRHTERFRDVDVALAEGYVPDPTGICALPEHEGLPRQLGGMGVHYFRPDLLGITATAPRVSGTGTHTDFRTPGILIYEPRPDGRLELVALENLVFADAWRAAGHSGAPHFLGNEYHYRHDNPETALDEAHGFEPHWELHLWLYRDNPTGLFMQYNPAVRCPVAAP